MHKELAKDGLVCISMSVDEPDNAKAALEFLKKMEATFPNYILDDTDEAKDMLNKTLPNSVPPIIHVFDRDGKKVKTWEGNDKEGEVDKFVKELLQKK
jgi:hypothetical protein